MSSIAVITRPQVDQEEASALNYLGQVIAANGGELVIADTGAGNQAVIAGYRERGREPTLGRGVLTRNPDAVVVFGDDELTTILDERQKQWRETKHVLLTSTEQLYAFLDMITYHLEQTS